VGIVTKGEFEDLFLRHRVYLLGLAKRVLARTISTAMTPDDVVQEAALKTYRLLDGSQPPGQIVSLLRLATRHVAIDAIRRPNALAMGQGYDAARAQGIINGTRKEDGSEEQCAAIVDDRSMPDAEEAWALLDSLTEKMCPNYGDALVMDYAGFTAEEAAALLGVTVSAYKSRLYRARKQAQEIVGPLHLFASLPRPVRRIVR
jgi:RNA polymerase sigma factor (sigma-70 family)